MSGSRILYELKKFPGEYVSGERLSHILGVSRTAVWKEIEKLREEGYVIASSSRKGYLLEQLPDLLTEKEIQPGLQSSILGKRIVFRQEVDSTNNLAKTLAAEECPEGTTVIAEEQLAGKGRLGRQWHSAKGMGIWMSVVLRPNLMPEKVQMITMIAGLSVVQAIRELLHMDCCIKWPNDIIMEGKKVCGILTEISAEMEKVNFLVVGMGINVHQRKEDFPEELCRVATSLAVQNSEGGQISRASLVRKILEAFEANYLAFLEGKANMLLEEYRRNSATLGKPVRVVRGEEEYTAEALDVNDEGKLLVKCGNGQIREISSGEVSVRGLLGYS